MPGAAWPFRPAVLLSIALVLSATAPKQAHADTDWSSLSASVSARWVPLQNESGTFPDYVVKIRNNPERDGYGTAMLGYALLQSGLRTDDRPQVDAGLRALGHAMRHPTVGRKTIFEDLALAGAYLLAERELGSDPAYISERPAWQEHLRHVRFTLLDRSTKYTNWRLVEALETIELTSSGLRSPVPGTVLANPARSRRLARNLIERQLPAATRAYTRGGTSIVSDPPANPLAYHAFSSGLFARSLELLGSEARPQTRALFRRMVSASWAFVAPDGDVSYFGRSQQQSWTLAMTSYAATVAARLPGTSPSQAAHFAALSDRVLQRLHERYLGGPYGLWITPALREEMKAGVAGLDLYAAAVSYTGLTLVGVNWMLEQPRLAVPPAAAAADADGEAMLSRGDSSFAVIRRSRLWFAVKRGRRAVVNRNPHAGDLRYEAGLVSLKARSADGAWHDVTPLRPVVGRLQDAAGLQFIGTHASGRLEGTSLRVLDGGSVLLRGGYRTLGGRWLRRGESVRFTPVACGVRIELSTKPGERYSYTGYFRDYPRVGEHRVGDAEQTISFDGPARVSRRRGYSSGQSARLVQARISFPPATGRRIALTVCSSEPAV